MRERFRPDPVIVFTRIHIPVFFFVSYLAIGNIIKLGVITFSEPTNLEVNFSGHLITLSILAVYIALLPLPLVHLTWDNKFEGNWRKLGTSIVLLVVLLGANFFVGWMANSELCTNGIHMDDAQCRLYGVPPDKRLSGLVQTMRSSTETITTGEGIGTSNKPEDTELPTSPNGTSAVEPPTLWKTAISSDYEYQIDIPSEWELQNEAYDRINASGLSSAIQIRWMEQDTGTSIADDVMTLDAHSYEADTTARKWREFMETKAEDTLPQVIELSGPHTVKEQGVVALYHDILISKANEETEPVRLIVLYYDCYDRLICVVDYFREGQEEVSEADWRIIWRATTSLEIGNND